MIGAIYLDKGYDYANRLMINTILRNNINLRRMTQTEMDFKSRMIEWSQKNKRALSFNTAHSPQYTTQSPHFQTTVVIDGKEISQGEGASKKEAEQQAALRASEKIKQESTEDQFEPIDIEFENPES